MFVHVYDNGHDKRPHRLTSPAVRVTPHLNAGREGRIWLEHFIRHYDDLPRWVYLAQGDPHQDPAEFRRRLKVPYTDTTGLTREYLPHFPPDWIKAKDVAEWHQPPDDGPPIEVRYGRAIHQGGHPKEHNEAWLRRAWAHFFACPPPDPIEDWTYAYGAMYAVPRRRITDRPIEFWRWCHDVIARPVNQEERSWGSGYVFELLWRYLLGDAERWPVRLPPPPPGRRIGPAPGPGVRPLRRLVRLRRQGTGLLAPAPGRPGPPRDALPRLPLRRVALRGARRDRRGSPAADHRSFAPLAPEPALPDTNPVVVVPTKLFDGTAVLLQCPTYTDQALFALGGLAVKGDVAPNGDGTGRFHRYEVDFNGPGTLVVDNMGLARLSVGGFTFDFWPKDIGPGGRVDFYPIVQPTDITSATGALAPAANVNGTGGTGTNTNTNGS